MSAEVSTTELSETNSNSTEILLRYHEIAIKGDNRGWFEGKLATNSKRLLKAVLGKDTSSESAKVHGRILVKTEWNQETAHAFQTQLFGLSSFSPIVRVATDIEKIRDQAIEVFRQLVESEGLPSEFRVKTRRSDKALPETSKEIDLYVGSAIHDLFPSVKVNLSQNNCIVGIEIRRGESFVWCKKVMGPGGLPVGTNAPVLSLMSGGIDSPVAAIQILKRGSPNHFIHFYGTPFVGEDALDKIKALVKIVNRFQPDAHCLHVVPFGKIQEKIALQTNPKMRTILYRRMMIRIANAVAKRIGASALVTGESLGQVASQTVENLATINSVSELPILRPLISFDKDEITEKAQKYGTYETSILPATDCCTLFSDRHPTLRSQESVILEQESRFSIQEMVDEALKSIERINVGRG